MIRWFDVGQEAQGVIAIGQQATGVIAIGQLATGVIAIGQLARGVFVVGQLAIGIASVSMLGVGVVINLGMVGVGGTSPGLWVLPVLPWRAAATASPSAVALAGVGEVGAVTAPRRLPPRLLLRLAVLALLVAAWWVVAGVPLLQALAGQGGVLRPIPMPR